jgi:hypothetical protein
VADEYTKDDLLNDMEALRRLGLIEVIGVREDGEWLWGVTQKSLNMTDEERIALIETSFGEDVE